MDGCLSDCSRAPGAQIYFGSEVFASRFPFAFVDHDPKDHFLGGRFMTHEGALASNILGVGCWIAVAMFLHHKRVYVAL